MRQDHTRQGACQPNPQEENIKSHSDGKWRHNRGQEQNQPGKLPPAELTQPQHTCRRKAKYKRKQADDKRDDQASRKPVTIRGSLSVREKAVAVHSVGKGWGKNQRVEKAYTINKASGAARMK